MTFKDSGSGTVPVDGAFRAREPVVPSEDPTDRSEAGYAYLHREIWVHGQQDYPSGTEACDLRGWSIDDNPAGLNVYLKPSPDSRLLGTLPPRYRFPDASEAAPEEGFFTEFDIIGYRDGWFMIEHAEPPGRSYADPESYPDDHPEPFAGRGWIPADRVGAQYANGDMPVRAEDENGVPVGGLYQAPSIDAAWTPALNEYGSDLSRRRPEAHPRLQRPVGARRKPRRRRRLVAPALLQPGHQLQLGRTGPPGPARGRGRP